MPYKILKKQPPIRDESVAYDAIAPGLYPDETAFELDDGSLVAVSVERHWQENGSGIAFHGYARWMNLDGSTITAPNGAHVEAAMTFHADPVTLETHGADALASDIARLLIGEECQLTREVPEEDEATSVMPVVDVSEQGKLNASVRHQIKAVTATKSHLFTL